MTLGLAGDPNSHSRRAWAPSGPAGVGLSFSTDLDPGHGDPQGCLSDLHFGHSSSVRWGGVCPVVARTSPLASSGACAQGHEEPRLVGALTSRPMDSQGALIPLGPGPPGQHNDVSGTGSTHFASGPSGDSRVVHSVSSPPTLAPGEASWGPWPSPTRGRHPAIPGCAEPLPQDGGDTGRPGVP